MGKIRIKTLGSEEEQDEKKKAKQRAEAKRIEAVKKLASEKAAEPAKAENVQPQVSAEAAPEKKVKTKYKKEHSKNKKTYSSSYLAVAANIDKNKKYKLKEALEILPKLQRAKFDETVELHFNTIDKGISGNITLPHGTGKKIRIETANYTENAKHVEELVKKIEAGQIDFDVLIATPETMAKLAKVARILGPRGLMPNPKNGTVTPKPEIVAKQFEGGQINFKTEAKFPLLHLIVGKVSFGEEKLAENIKTAVAAVQTKNIKKVVLKSTMSPSMTLDSSTL